MPSDCVGKHKVLIPEASFVELEQTYWYYEHLQPPFCGNSGS